MRIRHPWFVLFVSLASLVLASSVGVESAKACTIPVFRYALERWKPAPYQLVVFQRGALSKEDKVRLEALQSKTVNLSVELVDLDGKLSEELRVLWQAQLQRGALKGLAQAKDAGALPWAVLLHPENPFEGEPVTGRVVWQGTFSEWAANIWLDSPVRQRLVNALTQGESAVWLVLESGIATEDKAAYDLLTSELSRLQKVIQLPEQRPDGPPLRVELPLRVAFSVIRVPKTGLNHDQGLVETVVKHALAKGAKGPLVVPVVGRGRALHVLHGEGLTAKEIESWARELCGPCGCEIKDENPGFDLLIQADWDEILLTSPMEEPQNPTTKPTPIPISTGRLEMRAAPDSRTGASTGADNGTPQAPRESEQVRNWLWLATGVVIVLVVVGGVRTLRRHKYS